VNQVPMTDQSMRPSSTNPGRTYRFYTGQAVYPFGYGLSFTTFNYSIAGSSSISSSSRHRNSGSRSNSNANSIPILYTSDLLKSGLADDRAPAIDYSINVTNTGNVPSDVSVLAFLSGQPDPTHPAAASPPLSTLVGFDKLISLQPGQTATVYFFVQVRQLLHVDAAGDKWLLPGVYETFWGDSANKEISHKFQIQGQPALFKEWKGKHWNK